MFSPGVQERDNCRKNDSVQAVPGQMDLVVPNSSIELSGGLPSCPELGGLGGGCGLLEGIAGPRKKLVEAR